MTTIAWDGIHLAADRRCTSGNVRREFTKLRSDGGIRFVWATCGSAEDAEAFDDWMRNNMPLPRPTLGDDFAALVINVHESQCTRYEGRLYGSRIVEPYAAAGSGRDFALAALALGYDARRAVEVASQFDIYTGEGIDVWPDDKSHLRD